MDIDILLEDLDILVNLSNTNRISMASWLSLANSAVEIRRILEKQTPKGVNYKEYEVVNGDLIMVNRHDYSCPMCDKRDAIFDINGMGLQYCGECGQKLKWE